MLARLVELPQSGLQPTPVAVTIVASGALVAERPLAGTVAAVLGASGPLQARRPLAGGVALQLAAAGPLAAKRPLAGVVALALAAELAADVLVGPGRAATETRAALAAAASQVP